MRDGNQFCIALTQKENMYALWRAYFLLVPKYFHSHNLLLSISASANSFWMKDGVDIVKALCLLPKPDESLPLCYNIELNWIGVYGKKSLWPFKRSCDKKEKKSISYLCKFSSVCVKMFKFSSLIWLSQFSSNYIEDFQAFERYNLYVEKLCPFFWKEPRLLLLAGSQ